MSNKLLHIMLMNNIRSHYCGIHYNNYMNKFVEEFNGSYAVYVLNDQLVMYSLAPTLRRNSINLIIFNAIMNYYVIVLSDFQLQAHI